MKNTFRISSISIVIPMFNEAQNINLVLNKTINFLNTNNLKGEIIIVNDGSSDQTADLAEKAALLDNRIRVFHHQRNYGLGRTVRTGLQNAKYEWILYIDGDDPFDLNELSKLDRLTEEYDMLIGYRINRDEGFRRFLLSKCYRILISLTFKIRFTDINCAFKLFRKSILKKVLLSADGSFISLELVAKSIKEGFKVKEVGINYRPRTLGESTLSSPLVILKILAEMIKYKILGN